MKKFLLILFLSTFSLHSEEDASITEKSSVTEHSATIGDKLIEYKATTGTLILKDQKGLPQASIYYTAYTKIGEDQNTRPVTFCFNGGPGAASIWLHMGAFGPKRCAVTDEGIAVKPYRLEENPYSILDLTDLVFIDPVSTGFSKPAKDVDPNQFYTSDGDVESIARFIQLWTNRHNRYLSPKFLAGESYGTTRAALLADHLLSKCSYNIDGIVLVSTILDFQSTFGSIDYTYAFYLPSFTATAWKHNMLSSELQEMPLAEVLKIATEFANGPYINALFQGDLLPPEKYEEILQKLSYFTGISTKFLDYANLRLESNVFRKKLLQDNQLKVGRMDSRITGIEVDQLVNMEMQKSFSDPSILCIDQAYKATFNHYVKNELLWEEDYDYKIINFNVNRAWVFANSSWQGFSVVDSFKVAMQKNPDLKVFVASGIYDLAIPINSVYFTFSHMNFNDEMRSRITMEDYEAGHMMYTHKPSLIKFKEDLKNYYEKALN